MPYYLILYILYNIYPSTIDSELSGLSLGPWHRHTLVARIDVTVSDLLGDKMKSPTSGSPRQTSPHRTCCTELLALLLPGSFWSAATNGNRQHEEQKGNLAPCWVEASPESSSSMGLCIL